MARILSKSWRTAGRMVLALALSAGSARFAAADLGREARSILSDQCFACHGPDAGARKGGLRLDLIDEARQPLKSGRRAVIPGDPDGSELLRRILTPDEEDRMPPAKSGKTLSPAQTEVLRRWIAGGAQWDTHWAFAPVKRPPVPDAETPGSQNEIDHFIRARLKQEGLNPSPEAGKPALLRRVTFDLTGLPPTVEEIDAFLADSSADAYRRVVDRLLASQRYGEHMARYWLDAVRYADSHGYHLDTERDIWAYRDWVIQALNDNMPFDQFTLEQIAGDLLPGAGAAQRIASGYNRCNLTTNEGGAIEEEYQAKSGFDRTETTGTVWLGLTLTCARCHSHKYDPVSQTEYFGLYAFFNNFDEPVMDGNVRHSDPHLKLPDARQAARQQWLEARIAEAENTLFKPDPEPDQAREAWQREWREKLSAGWTNEAALLSPWRVIGPLRLNSLRHGYEQRYEPEIRLEFDQTLPGGFEEVKWQEKPQFADGKRNALVPDVYSVRGNGVFYLHRRLRLAESRPATFTFRADDWFKVWLNGALIGARDQAEKAGDGPLVIERELAAGEHDLLIKVVNYEAKLCFFTFTADFHQPGIPPTGLLTLLGSKEIPDADKRMLQGWHRAQNCPDTRRLFEDWQRWRDERTILDRQIPTTLIARERKDRRETFVLARGEYDQKTERVEPSVPGVLNPFPEGAPRNRLGFAQWLVNGENPLTARVIVNRYWQQFFGTGLVKTAEDFGVQGEAPSHPELLDWLAAEFMESGWNVKELLRKIVLSASYRQSSRADPALTARDPENRLLARGPRFRLDAEMIRDNALFLSGQLVSRMGGPGARPWEPPGLWESVSHENRLRYVPDEGEGRFRRSVYTVWKRQSPPPNMLIFDAPTREMCVARRPRTSTPLQALALLNDPQFAGAAEALGRRMIAEGGPDAPARVRWGFRRATGRLPSPREEAIVLEAAARQSSGDELQIWAAVASLLLNLDETMTKN